MLLILLSVLMSWHFAYLASKQATFHAECILSELGNVLNRCHINSSFITFYFKRIHCSILHSHTTHSL